MPKLQFLTDDQSNHQQQYYAARLENCTTSGTYLIKSCSTSYPIATAIGFISDFIYNFPDTSVENALQISTFGVFLCRMASHIEPYIFQEICEFNQQLLNSPISSSVYARFQLSSFEDLAALSEFSLMLPSSDVAEHFQYEDRCCVVELIQMVALIGGLSSDRMKLALLRLKWGCIEENNESEFVKSTTSNLLMGMGVTRDNFVQLLPNFPKNYRCRCPVLFWKCVFR